MPTKSQMINVTMGFNADVSKAKAQLQDLQNSLTALMNTTKGKGVFNLTEDLNESIKGVALLKAQLKDATNANTGKLDLSKFNQSLKESGMSLEKYRNLFSNMGAAGDRAFAQLATSITKAEIPLKRSSKLVNNLWTTLKNTAQWQLSSSIMHGFVGAVQTALHYTQDLNRSLNDIRIVTGYNTDQMAKFAKEANRAAKQLSTTTTDYTNASLIYYQQGLPEEEIAKRTEVTIKMANAAGVSAETVSDQMTAVWNNFDNGSKSLEYYADVMTALGAATASSTDEIAAGLEKFAAVSSTVGLSYEYATAALATVTAETRQNADVVGNAFKTLFSRIQGLNLGETLDDGTNLNKYSKALAKVGIDIKDTSGEIKEMDVILDNLGERWKTLAKDEQLAVAQTVAGVRQYTQLIALMDNWETFKKNVIIAEDSEGTVSQQAEIYAESWDAARDRVKAAAEGIYDSLLNDEFFIDVNNGFAEFLTGIENVIDGLGGMGGVITLIGTIFTRVFNKQITQGIKNTIYSLKMMTKTGQQQMRKFQNEANALLIKEMLDSGNQRSFTATSMQEQAKAQQAYLDNVPYMSEIQKMQANMFMDKQQKLTEEIQLLDEEFIKIKRNAEYQDRRKIDKVDDSHYLGLSKMGNAKIVGDQNRSFSSLAKLSGELEGSLLKVHHGFEKIDKTNLNNVKKELETFLKHSDEISLIYPEASQAIENFKNKLQGLNINSTQEEFDDFRISIMDLYATMTTGSNGIDLLEGKIDSLENTTEEQKASLKAMINIFHDLGTAEGEVAGKTDNLGKFVEKLKGAFAGLRVQQVSAIDGVVALGSAVGSLALSIQSIKGLKDVWSDEDTSQLDKILTTVTTLSFILPSLKASFQFEDIKKMGVLFGQLGNKLVDVTKGTGAAAAAAGKMAAANKGATAGVAGMKAALGQLGTTIGAAVAGFTAFIAIAAAVGVAIYALVKHINRYKDAAEDAKDAAQELSDASLETKNKLNDIKSAFDAYDTAKNALSECTRGTDEWNEKLKEVNENALSLLETYPELMKYSNLFIRNEDGVLELNEAVKTNAIKELEKQSASIQAASYLSNANATQASVDLQAHNLKNKIGIQTLTHAIYDENGYLSEYHEKGYNIDEIFTKENLSKLIDKKSGEEFSDALKEILKKPADATDISYNLMIASISKYQSEIDNLADAATEATNELVNAADLIVDSNFEGLDAADNEYASKMIEKSSKAWYDEIMKADKNNWASGGGGNAFDKDRKAFVVGDTEKTLSELWEVYERAVGEQGSLKDNAIRGWAGDKKIVFDNVNTGKQDDINIEKFASVVSAQLALEELGQNAENASKALSKISDNAEGVDFRNYIANKDFAGMTSAELSKYQGSAKYVTESGITEKTYYNSQGYLEKVFNTNDIYEFFNKNQEMFNTLGYYTVEELLNEVQTAIDGQADKLTAIGTSLVDTVRLSYNNAIDKIGSKLNTEEHEKIGEILTKVFADEGAAAMEQVSNAIAGMGDYADEFLDVVEEIDWNTITVEDFKNQLENAGVSTKGLDEELNYLITSMKNAEDATRSLTEAQELHASLQELGNLQIGDTINQEQMKQMTDINPALAQYFQLMGDGTYALVEQAEHFKGVAEDSSFIPLVQQIEKLQKQQQGLILTDDLSSAYRYNGELNKENATAGLEFLISQDYNDTSKLAEWRESLNNVGLSGKQLTEMSQAIQECIGYTGEWTDGVANLQQEMDKIQESINFTAYKDHVEDLGLDFGVTERYAQDLAEAMKNSGQEYDNLEEAARNLAIANQRLDRGLSNLASNLDDYNEKLSDSNRYSKEYSEALQNLKTDIADIFNTDAELLSDNFIEEKLVGDPETLKEIADGNIDTINSLRQAVAEDIIATIKTNVDYSKIGEFETWYNQFQANFPDLQTGVFLSPESEYAFIEALNGMSKAAGMTRDEVNALLGSMGMSAELQTTYKETEVEVPVYTTSTREAGKTIVWDTAETAAGPVSYPKTYTNTETFTVQTDTKKMTGMVPVTSVKTIAADGTKSGGGIDIQTNNSASGAPSISPSASNVYNPSTGKGGYTGNKKSSGGGGGSSKPKQQDRVEKDKEIDRYKEINDELDAIARQLKKIQGIEDTLYGASKIAAMEHEVEVLRQQEAAYKAKAAAARSNIDADREAFNATGYSVSFDFEGNISNYNALMNQAIDDLNSYIDQYNAMTAEQQEAFQPVLDSAQERYDQLKEAISQYEDTLQTFRDAEEAAEEARLARLAKNYEILTHELEYKLYDVEARIKEIDYYVNKLSDDFYSMGEALAILSGKTDEYFNSLEIQSNFLNKLDAQYAAGEITQADYIDGLKDSYDAILDNLEAIQELDKEMLEYYGETLDAAQDELEKYTDQMEHLVSITDHYRSILDLIGRNEDYDTIGAIIEGQASMYHDQMEVSKAYYEMLLDQKASIEASMNSVEEGSEAWEGYKKQWDDIVVEVNEAQDKMLSNTENWLKAEKELLENHIASQAKQLESILTESYGGSFDEMAKKMDALRERSEEFLTETNKIYETNKLLRKAQMDLDKTTNEGAKLKIKNYIDSTTALQKQNEVSNLELEIQQAKYDLLLAEIALEEAQNAKSRVRLQRDSEGNFGYVYTSDAEAVNQAEQDFEDAQNRLYNIGLNGAAEYADKYAQTLQAMYDELGALQQQYLEGGFANEEEYNAAVEAAKQKYYQKLEDYSHLYYIAIDTDNALRDESWTVAFDSMISKTDEWQIEVDKYIDNINIAFENWKEKTNEANSIVGETLDETKEKVEELTDASSELKDEVVGEVVPAIQSELNIVQSLTSAYFAQRAAIMAQVQAYEELARAIREKIAAEAAANSYQAPSSENLSGSTTGGNWTPAPEGTPSQNGGDDGGGTGSVPKTYYKFFVRTDYGSFNGKGYPSNKAARVAIQSYKGGDAALTRGSYSITSYTSYNIESPTKDPDVSTSISGGGGGTIRKNMVNMKFDTGGYTGSWGPEGKLATLHEKELVLNKHDTKNMLSAVEIVRDITNQIENSSKYFGGLSTLQLPSIGHMMQELEQQIHIDANFPNVVDRYEIENAFENLFNMASQFANRKRL